MSRLPPAPFDLTLSTIQLAHRQFHAVSMLSIAKLPILQISSFVARSPSLYQPRSFTNLKDLKDLKRSCRQSQRSSLGPPDLGRSFADLKAEHILPTISPIPFPIPDDLFSIFKFFNF
jgi:hypothetical protein